jgi:phosphate transport system permease protein
MSGEPSGPAGSGHSTSSIEGRASGWFEAGIEKVLFACAALSVLTTVGIIGVLIFESAAFFQEVSIFEYFGNTVWTPLFSDKHFGIWPLISGTLLTSAIAIAFALPFGLLAAIYLSEFASENARRILKPALEILAGVPTIVYGYFALIFVTPMLQKVVPGLSGFNALSPGLVMGVMIIPMISSLTEDAIHSVPDKIREASQGLGAGKLETIGYVVLPASRSGIVAAVILAVSRAIGETMIVTVAAGQQAVLTADPRVPIQTMTSYIVQVAMGDVPTGTLAYNTIFVVGATLFVMTFVMNIISQRFAQSVRGGR